MMIKTVQSFAELDAGISLSERSFPLLFKGGTELEFDGKEYLMMPYADILGRIVETDEI